MDCLESESVCSVKKENNSGYYRIHTIWKENGFRINIASRDGAWTGEMTHENVRSISSELNVDTKKYLAECKEVLTTDDGRKGYFYSVENGSFIWKKLIDEDSGIKIRVGSVMVQPVSFVDTIQNIIEVALKCKKNLNNQLNTLKQEKESNVQKQQFTMNAVNKPDIKGICQLQEKLEELSHKKTLMENDLYSKFLLLLNSKKRKIRELEASDFGNKKICEKSAASVHSEYIEKNSVEQTTIIKAYDLDTDEDEDEDDCREEQNVPLHCTTSHEETKEKVSDNFAWVKDSAVTEESEKGPWSVNTGLEIQNNGENTPDLDDTCGSSSIPGLSNMNEIGNSEIVKERNKSFPATKADILDFFFGSSSYN